MRNTRKDFNDVVKAYVVANPKATVSEFAKYLKESNLKLNVTKG